ncbi:MAG: HAMP domain-containing histidine kinase [Firmicutes bacterium]|nr:HAMP domain-containing histidine kinase [Dethiobacter sp.]MBS3888008.1 HAMP domain-containing histidine kinase [Bacillota bacterium]MBS4055410.1 HAMP domain-containing histidine kinase [Thermaerobacter sp.]
MRRSIYAELVLVFVGVVFIGNLLVSVGYIMSIERQLLTDYYPIYPDVKQHIINFRHVMGRFSVTSLVVGSVLFLFAAAYIVKPIRSLSEATKRIAQGNFSVRLPEKRQDEIGQLIVSFNAMAKELQSIEMLRSDFVSAISHEFKTPLTSIRGYAKLLGESETDETKKEYAAIIMEETERLSHLASNILLLTQLEQDGATLVRESFRLDEQLRKVVLLLESAWQEKGLKLQIEMPEVFYLGNEQLLYQVWINLLDNAIKFSPAGSPLTITLHERAGSVECEISDAGEGIPPELHGKVFEKFYKADKSRTGKGNGLGLSIVKRIVAMHGGAVLLSCVVGQGTTVTVRLPS